MRHKELKIRRSNMKNKSANDHQENENHPSFEDFRRIYDQLDEERQLKVDEMIAEEYDKQMRNQ